MLRVRLLFNPTAQKTELIRQGGKRGALFLGGCIDNLSARPILVHFISTNINSPPPPQINKYKTAGQAAIESVPTQMCFACRDLSMHFIFAAIPFLCIRKAKTNTFLMPGLSTFPIEWPTFATFLCTDLRANTFMGSMSERSGLNFATPFFSGWTDKH